MLFLNSGSGILGERIGICRQFLWGGIEGLIVFA